MSTTMWSLLAVCVVAFIMHPTPVTSYWCKAKDCSKINSNVNALKTSVTRIHDSLEQQQQLQQKQQTLNQKLNAQLATLKETGEQQRKQNQQQKYKLAKLSLTVEQQQKQIQNHDRQLTSLKKLGEQQQIELKQAGIQNQHETLQLKKQIVALNPTIKQLQQQQNLQKAQLKTLQLTVEKQQKLFKNQMNKQQEIEQQATEMKQTVDRQQKLLQQQDGLLVTLKRTVELQQKWSKEQQSQLTKHENTLAGHEKVLRELKKAHEKTTPTPTTTTPTPTTTSTMTTTTTSIPTATDCVDLHKAGHSADGVYNINVKGKSVQVYCELSGKNGGWLVIQRRIDNTTDFFRDWKSYKDGFGDLTRNFWLGNDNLHAITAQKKYCLRVDLVDFEDEVRHALYTDFAVANEDNKYRLTVGSYSGTAGDSLSYHDGMTFSTRDRDNDRSRGNCAQRHKGGWWYNHCLTANLNGMYLGGTYTGVNKGIIWYRWHGRKYSLKNVVMSIRPTR